MMFFRSCLVMCAVLTSFSVASEHAADAAKAAAKADDAGMKLQLIRNATLKIQYGDTVFLLDPMLAAQGTYPGFTGTHRSELRNPLVELPMSIEDVVTGVDAVIVTHTHLDHWDAAAQEALPKGIPLFAQHAADADIIREQGFTDVRILTPGTDFNGITLEPTGGQHGSDELYAVPALAERMGEIMGVVFQATDAPTLYVAGDTVWRTEVEAALDAFSPDVVVLNAGAAEVNGFENDPIIMGREDTLRAYQYAPQAQVVAVHMDAINHMTLSRAELADYIAEQEIQDRVLIPADGEILNF